MGDTAGKAKGGAPAFASADLSDYAAAHDGKMQVQISSFENGLEIYRGISVIRVRGRDRNLMILEDCTPIAGRLDGDADFVGRDFYRTLKGVRGFFCHVHNVFFLILNETDGGSPKPAGNADSGEADNNGDTGI